MPFVCLFVAGPAIRGGYCNIPGRQRLRIYQAWHTVCMSSYSEYILPYLQRPRISISNWGMAMNGHCAGARSYGKSSQRRTGKIGQHLRLPLSLRAHVERHVLVAAERQTRSAFKSVMVAEMVRDCDPEALVPSCEYRLLCNWVGGRVPTREAAGRLQGGRRRLLRGATSLPDSELFRRERSPLERSAREKIMSHEGLFPAESTCVARGSKLATLWVQ